MTLCYIGKKKGTVLSVLK